MKGQIGIEVWAEINRQFGKLSPNSFLFVTKKDNEEVGINGWTGKKLKNKINEEFGITVGRLEKKSTFK